MKFLRLRALLPCLAAPLLSSCAVFHAGAPAASLIVSSTSGSAVEAAVIEAFTERNFRLTGNERHDLTFERDAGKFDSALYGNWNEEKLSERVVVQLIATRPAEYRLACIPFAVRGLGTGMDDATRRLQTFSREYSDALRDVRRRLSAPAIRPEPTAAQPR